MPRERLGALIDGYIDFLALNTSFAKLVQREILSNRLLDQIVAHMVPLFRTGEQLIQQAYPATRSGPLSAADLLVSFFGMIVSTFTYGPVVTGLTTHDPLSPEGLERRKQHLGRMIDLVIAELEKEDES
jgi:hypothetical protein